MGLKIFHLILFITFSSCSSSSQSKKINQHTASNKYTKTKSLKPHNENSFVDSILVYTDTSNLNVVIENSLPKGGLKYSDTDGIEYIYAVFWTRITNRTDNTFSYTIEYPTDAFHLTQSPEKQFKLLIAPDTLVYGHEALFNYGLELDSFLAKSLGKATTLSMELDPGENIGFYIVTLFNEGVDGVLRTGLQIKDNRLLYRVNGEEFPCGIIH